MKKYSLIVLFCLAALLLFSGCGKKKAKVQDASPAYEAAETEAPSETPAASEEIVDDEDDEDDNFVEDFVVEIEENQAFVIN